jgi:putative DNA primase/helicase
MIPFSVTIPPEERDETLPEKLRAEWPGILRWMLDGCRDWQQGGGLRPPAAVINATAEYLEAEDSLAVWIEERCERGPNYKAQSSVLFSSWSSWAEEAGEPMETMKWFSASLENRGFQKKKTNGGRFFLGLRPKPSDGHAYEAEWDR